MHVLLNEVSVYCSTSCSVENNTDNIRKYIQASNGLINLIKWNIYYNY